METNFSNHLGKPIHPTLLTGNAHMETTYFKKRASLSSFNIQHNWCVKNVMKMCLLKEGRYWLQQWGGRSQKEIWAPTGKSNNCITGRTFFGLVPKERRFLIWKATPIWRGQREKCELKILHQDPLVVSSQQEEDDLAKAIQLSLQETKVEKRKATKSCSQAWHSGTWQNPSFILIKWK